MNFYERALALKEELTANRRFIHANAEAGLTLPKTTAYITEKLNSYGIDARRCGEGVTATIGSGGKTILLRADMDALPMSEESGLPFACHDGYAHTCGHDLHSAMLLTAAKMLKEQEPALQGTVRLMFQPGEEVLGGCRNMIQGGILQNPEPDAALAFHVGAGRLPAGTYLYNDSGAALMSSTDMFHLKICGRGAHGAYPHLSVDPISIGVHIHLGLQELIAREADPASTCVLTVGSFTAGSAPNIIPESAVLCGSLRTSDSSEREKLVRRLREICEQIAAAYGGSAALTLTSEIPPLKCDSTFTRQIAAFLAELPFPNLTGQPGITSGASEDFALIAERIPSAMIYLSAGFADKRGDIPAHNPGVQFDEDVLPLGAAAYAHCAARWLAES